MIGTTINVGAILAGSLIGVAIGNRLPAATRGTVMQGLGIVTSVIGLKMALASHNVLIVLGATLAGALVGEFLQISERLDRFGGALEARLAGGRSSHFSEGFITASMVFCIGPMAILGSIQDGLWGDYQLLAVKSTLDGFASIAFASTLGWGVAFASCSVLLLQGGITAFAGTLHALLNDAMVADMTATGGVIIVGIGLKLMDLKDIRLANFLPGLVIAPLITAVVPLVQRLLAS
jgi:hypothetical protein